GGDKILQGIDGQAALLQPAHSVVQRHAGAGDGGAARAAVGLDHVAIDLYGALAQLLQVDDGAQAATDETLNFLRAAGLFAARRFAPRARVGGAREHAVFRGEPTL